MTGFALLVVAVTLGTLSKGVDYARLTPVEPLSPGAFLLVLAAAYAACCLVWGGLGLALGVRYPKGE